MKIPTLQSLTEKPLSWYRNYASTAADLLKSGIVSMFSGLLYCADCGEKLYYSVTNNYKREQAYFFCSVYRKNSDVCSAHYIREKVVEQLVLESMQRVLWYVQSCEKLFAQRQLAEFGEKQKKEFAEKRRGA